MIVSNLKLTFTMWGFLISAWNFDSVMSTIKTSSYIFALFMLTIWPLFILVFLQKNQHRLEDAEVKQKHNTIY